MVGQNTKSSPSPEELHYKSLLSLFKYLISILAILFGIIVWYLGNSISEIKENLNSELLSVREELKQAKADARNIVDIASFQKELFNESIKLYADGIARQKVEERLNSKTFTDLTKQLLLNEVDDKIDITVRESMTIFEKGISELPALSFHFERAYNQSERASILYIDSIANNANISQSIRNIANSSLERLRGLYYNPINGYLFDDNQKAKCNDELSNYKTKEQKLAFLKERILSSDSGPRVKDWICISLISDMKIKPFEYKKLRKL